MMAKMNRSLVMAAAALAAMSAFASAAQAGCGGDALQKHASFTTGSEGGAQLIPVQMQMPGNRRESPIVGMWSVTLTANGGTFDWGYQVWHSDGTEIMNSGSRAPASENFCLGVWEQSGPASYKLNHFALSYDPATGALNAKVNIKENVVVDGRGGTFSGPFTADIYSPAGNQVGHISGQITGQRVTAN